MNHLKHSIDEPSDTWLVAVTGMSPAVLTETVWALAHEAEPVIPNRVVAITTLAGREMLLRELFEPREALGGVCVWDDLRRALSEQGHDLSDRLRFGTTADDVRVITCMESASGRSRELADLRNLQENEAAADFLLDVVRGIAANPDTRLIASIAGGRKTMGALMYACMTLAGRETDRLTHILVNEPYETLPGFFFPGQSGPALKARQGDGLYAPADAVLELAEVPFVALRNLFQRELGQSAGNFSNLVASCRTEIRRQAAEGLRLELFVHRAALRLNHVDVALTEREKHLLLLLAERAKHEKPQLASFKEGWEALNQHAEEWDRLKRNGSLPANVPDAADFQDDQDVRRTLSDLRRKLRNLGQAGQILADALPARGRFSLDVPGPLIFVG